MKKYIKVTLFIVIFILLLLSHRVYGDAKILVFHRFDDHRYPSTNISNQRLREVFEYLKDNGYQVLSLEELVNQVEEGTPIDDRTVAFTIDDGYKSFYENGLEIFKEYNYPFTIFINSKAINYKYGDFLTWEQLKEISRYGSIGSHSYGHKHLTKLPLEELKSEVQRSIDDIYNNLGIKVKFFSYPYGEYDNRVKEVVKSFGFKAIFNQNLGAVSEQSDLFDLDRIAIGEDSNLKLNLSYKYLKVKWLDQAEAVEDDRLLKVEVRTSPDIEKAQLYISGYGWRKVELEEGTLSLDLDLSLKYSRNRVFLKTYDNRIASQIIVK
ncbi:polysaccharide deacetylase family protein [Orenia metallireducens]|uniref:polysaccharide deacetylase family protein n=1 Tax=Orenia metallireducens TaxID=1413210 RepID=UPI0009F4A1EF|nr:polysaccharide deacetylase family protein [Orenia metallireducens]